MLGCLEPMPYWMIEAKILLAFTSEGEGKKESAKWKKLTLIFFLTRLGMQQAIQLIMATSSCHLWILWYPAHRYHAVPSPWFEPTTPWLRIRRPNHSATTLHWHWSLAMQARYFWDAPQGVWARFCFQFLVPSSCDKVKNQIIPENERLYGGEKEHNSCAVGSGFELGPCRATRCMDGKMCNALTHWDNGIWMGTVVKMGDAVFTYSMRVQTSAWRALWNL
jgi:hypothetical protein